MAMTLSEEIDTTEVQPGQIAICWLGQAGFIFKTPTGTTVAVDPYLSDWHERTGRNRRIVPSPMRPEEMESFKLDLYLNTHWHNDHLDLDTLPFAVRNSRIVFAGPPSCVDRYREAGVSAERIKELGPGVSFTLGDTRVTGTFADHSAFTPDAIGLALDLAGVRVWHTGDTAFRPNEVTAASVGNPQVVIVCSNGAFGNCNSEEAARLVGHVNAAFAIPCHFWLFVSHNTPEGTPAAFVEACKLHAPNCQPYVMTIGRVILYPQLLSELSSK